MSIRFNKAPLHVISVSPCQPVYFRDSNDPYNIKERAPNKDRWSKSKFINDNEKSKLMQ